MLHAKYQSSWTYGFREEFLNFTMKNWWSKGWGHFGSGGQNLNKLGKCPLSDATCQISNVWALWFQRGCLNILLTPDWRTEACTEDDRQTGTTKAHQINCCLLNFSSDWIFKVLQYSSKLVKMLSECQTALIWVVRRRVTRRLIQIQDVCICIYSCTWWA